MGTCEYCGQVLAGAETDEEATAECLCFEATARRKRANAAKKIVHDLFGAGAEARGLVPLADGAVFALCALVDLIGRGDVQKVAVVVPAICTVRIAISGNKITVDRVEGKKVSGVAGEN